MIPRHRFASHRTTVAYAAGLSLILTLTACGSSTSTSSPSSASTSSAAPAAGGTSSSAGAAGNSAAASGKPVHLGMELLVTGLPFVAELQAGGNAAAKELGVTLGVSAPSTFDPPTAISQVNNFLSTGVDGIVIAPEPAPLWTRALTDAVSKSKGNTVTIQTPPAAGTTVKTYVGNDATDLGRQTATAAIKAAGLGANTTGEVIIGKCTPESTPLTQTVEGMKQAVTQLLPKATLLAPFNSKTVPSENFTAWEQEMRAHPAAALILGSCDQDGDSMIKAKKLTGGHFVIGATATSPGILAAIGDGTVASTVTQNWYVESYTAVRLLTDAVRTGKAPAEGWISPGIIVVTKANLAAITARDASPEGQAAFYKPLVTKLWANLAAATKPLSAAQG